MTPFHSSHSDAHRAHAGASSHPRESAHEHGHEHGHGHGHPHAPRDFSRAFAVGIVLFVITFAINSIASRVVGGQTSLRRKGQL